MNVRTWAPLLLASAIVGCGSEEDSDTSSSTDPVIKPNISISDRIVIKEPVNGIKNYSISISLSNTYTQDVSVAFAISHVSTSEVDVVSGTGSVVIPAGDKSKTIDVTIFGDNIDEDDEKFKIKLSTPVNATLNVTSHEGIYTIVDEDPDAEINFVTEFAQTAEGIGAYSVSISIDPVSEKSVSIPFEITGLASEGLDFSLLSTSPITMPAAVSRLNLDLDIHSDNLKEGGESIDISLQSPTNAVLGDKSKMYITIPGDIQLNDTGVTKYYDDSGIISSPSSSHPIQDASFGRDVTNNDDYDGVDGFGLVKIDMDGNYLPSNATTYSCIFDKATGLTWEKKLPAQVLPPFMSNDDLKTLLSDLIKASESDEPETYQPYPYVSSHTNWRANNYQYYWYNADKKTNGGATGAEGSKFPNTSYPVNNNCAFPSKNNVGYSSKASNCSTEKYAEAFNLLAICGYKNWQVPTIEQIRSIQNYSVDQVGHPTYFPNTAKGEYLSSTPSIDGTGLTWCIDSESSEVKYCNKQTQSYLRLVRGVAE